MQIPVIYCEHNQSVWEAAVAHGYLTPQYRVGLVSTAKPVDGEVRVAEVRAMRDSLPIPIFSRPNEHGKGEAEPWADPDEQASLRHLGSGVIGALAITLIRRMK